MKNTQFGRAIVAAAILVMTTLAKPIPAPNSGLNTRSLGEWVTHAKRATPIPASYVEQGPANGGQSVTLRIGVKPGDVEGLEAALMKASTPGGEGYGEHLTKEQVESFVKPSAESNEAIASWFKANGINPSDTLASPSGDRFTITLPVSQANKLLGTTFTQYTHTPTKRSVIRTTEYKLPETVGTHVDYIHPTTVFDSDSKAGGLLGDLEGAVGEVIPQGIPPFKIPLLQPPAEKPPVSFASGVQGGLGEGSESGSGADGAAKVPQACKNATTPACLRDLYGLPMGDGKGGSGQSKFGMAVTGFIGQDANRKDLTTFVEKFRPDITKSKSKSVTFGDANIDGGSNSQEATDAGIEANLDIQYSVGVVADASVPAVNVTFVSVGNNNTDGDLSGFLDVMEYFLKMEDEELPRVVTTSYGANEADLDPKLQNNLCNAYMQLTSRGVTVLFSSGDGGVAGTQPGGQECKNFLPTFPSGCPYVTSVGATHSFGPEKGSNFSSGGFSDTFKVPSWQSTTVSGYLAKMKGDKKYAAIKGRFNTTGRGFPDVSLNGENYQVVVGGKTGSVSGTSASTPVFAAIVSMLNAELSKAGKKSIGFLNPLLYSPGAQAAFNDVTTGRNPGCQTDGFWATDGWDAVTGLGTPKYQALRTLVGLQ